MHVKLWAISDLHLAYAANRDALDTIASHPNDWLILAGDIGETSELLTLCFSRLRPKFAKLIWVPGNHELWTMKRDELQLRGVKRYAALVELARRHDVLTPEDPWPVWPGEGPKRTVVPMFIGYDYTFGPRGLDPDAVKAWSLEAKIRCTDESVLHPDPHPSLQAWCEARLAITERRLADLDPTHRTILINHWPLRRDICRLFRIPRFSPWCGTRRTEDWHRRYRADVVVCGHLHMRATDYRDGVRFEEVAVGYPRHWRSALSWDAYLREILPGPAARPAWSTPIWSPGTARKS